MPQVDILKPWLDFVSTLIWQLILIGLLIYFRKPLRDLVNKLAKIKFGEAELTFEQQPSHESISLASKAEVELKMFDSTGFLTTESVKRLIDDSGLVQPEERVKHVLLLFHTKRQRTWLLSTNKQLFCVLDDEKTRSSGRLIQWKLSLEQASPIKALPDYKRTVGLIDIGKKTNWLYSKRLHPDPQKLEAEIVSLISDSKA